MFLESCNSPVLFNDLKLTANMPLVIFDTDNLLLLFLTSLNGVLASYPSRLETYSCDGVDGKNTALGSGDPRFPRRVTE